MVATKRQESFKFLNDRAGLVYIVVYQYHKRTIRCSVLDLFHFTEIARKGDNFSYTACCLSGQHGNEIR